MMPTRKGALALIILWSFFEINSHSPKIRHPLLSLFGAQLRKDSHPIPCLKRARCFVNRRAHLLSYFELRFAVQLFALTIDRLGSSAVNLGNSSMISAKFISPKLL
jgi:hypothetical protein